MKSFEYYIDNVTELRSLKITYTFRLVNEDQGEGSCRLLDFINYKVRHDLGENPSELFNNLYTDNRIGVHYVTFHVPIENGLKEYSFGVDS